MQFISEPAVITAVAAAGARDRLLTFLTRDQRRRAPLRASGSRAACTSTTFYEPLQGGELVFRRAREGSYGRLASFVPQRVWPGIRAGPRPDAAVARFPRADQHLHHRR